MPVTQRLDPHRPATGEVVVGPAGQRLRVHEVALLEAHAVDPRSRRAVVDGALSAAGAARRRRRAPGRRARRRAPARAVRAGERGATSCSDATTRERGVVGRLVLGHEHDLGRHPRAGRGSRELGLRVATDRALAHPGQDHADGGLGAASRTSGKVRSSRWTPTGSARPTARTTSAASRVASVAPLRAGRQRVVAELLVLLEGEPAVDDRERREEPGARPDLRERGRRAAPASGRRATMPVRTRRFGATSRAAWREGGQVEAARC